MDNGITQIEQYYLDLRDRLMRVRGAKSLNVLAQDMDMNRQGLTVFLSGLHKPQVDTMIKIERYVVAQEKEAVP